MRMAISERDLSTNFIKILKTIPGGENILNCIQCGACAAICPSYHEGLNPFRVIQMASSGLIADLSEGDAIWACNKCFLCIDVCPQSVQPAEVISIIRGLVNSRSAPGKRHSEAIIRSIRRTGRLDEALVALRTLERDPRGLLLLIRLGIQLLVKRRVHQAIQRPIPNLEEVRRIYELLGA